MPRRAAALLPLLALALAGCLAQPAPAGLVPAALPSYAYACGAGGEAQAAPCIARLGRTDAWLAEPYVAAHPADPAVWAVGFNVGPPLAEYALGLPAQAMGLARLGLYLTRDGGATWQEAYAPSPGDGPHGAEPAVLDVVGDPAMVFDEQGRLHVTGLANAGTAGQLASFVLGQGDNGIRAFYARTDDLGASWAVGPVVLSEHGDFQDRNWIARDPATGALYVVWQNVGDPSQVERSERTVEVAWSLDGGATWSAMAPEQRAPCLRAGPATVHRGTFLFACDHLEGGAHTFQVYAFDPATGGAALRGTVDRDGNWPGLVPLPDGRLAMWWHHCFGDGCVPGSSLAWSDDGGATWSEPVALFGLLDPAGGWQDAEIKWVAPDPWGALHVLARTRQGDPAAELPVVGEVPPRTYGSLHLVLDRGLAKVAEAELGRWDGLDLDLPPPASPFAGDHFHGLAWSGERGLAAVAFGGASWATGLAPRPAGVGG